MKRQETTFYEQLQNCSTLDLRDPRGKKHDLAPILIGLVLGLLRKRDGVLSSIHRSIVNKYEIISSALGIDNQKVVSRSQLPEILKKVHLPSFEKILFENYGIELSKEEKRWFAGDGKELRGSIEKGKKRGTAIVQLVTHSEREVLGQKFYDGTKESEKPCLRDLLVETKSTNQKITADALHLNPATTELIAKDGGLFIIGLKNNQPTLLEDMIDNVNLLRPINELVTIEKGHGRLEKRSYFHYDIEAEYFDERWKNSDFKSLFSVKRERLDLKTNTQSQAVDLYISNGAASAKEDYFSAIREHWSSEVNNHIRDVTLQEDALKTKIKPITKVMAGLRTLTIKLLGYLSPKNFVAQLEFFQDDCNALIKWLKSINFL